MVIDMDSVVIAEACKSSIDTSASDGWCCAFANERRSDTDPLPTPLRSDDDDLGLGGKSPFMVSCYYYNSILRGSRS